MFQVYDTHAAHVTSHSKLCREIVVTETYLISIVVHEVIGRLR